MLESLTAKGFEVEFHSHAKAILEVDFPEAVEELEAVLSAIAIPIEEIIGSGGGETQATQRLRRALAARGWTKMNFLVEKRINGKEREAISHEIDHVKEFERGVIALEIEWNNKDPFFDRDLENYKRLHADGAISVGVIVTRGASLQAALPRLVRTFAEGKGLASIDDVRALKLNPTPRQQKDVLRRVDGGATFPAAWSAVFCADKYGAATTHWRKLEDRVHRGVGNPCPLVLVGMPESIVTFGTADVTEAAEEAGGETEG